MSDFSITYQEYQNRVANSIKNHRRIISQLQSMLIMRKDLQKDIYNDMVTHCLDSLRVVDDVINNDINIDSIKRYNMVVDQEGGTYSNNDGNNNEEEEE